MNDRQNPHAPTRHVHARCEVPRTWGGLALYVGFAALVPLTLFALAHPRVVAAGVTGVTVGLLARPVLRSLARRPDHHAEGVERPSNAVSHTPTKD